MKIMCSEFVGLDFEEVKLKLFEREINYRIVRRDGKPYIVTCDYNPERVNIELENNIVINIYTG